MVPYFISEWILMVLFTGLTVSGSPVRGVVGQNVTLPCKYRVNRPSDITTMCWGRGSCPSFQCSQPILWTDGWRVTKRQSSRYQLEGNLTRGDVSLTIVNVAEADGGVYCCRVEIPGWFNDQQKNLEVAIETAAANASDTPSTVAPQWPLVFSSEAPQDASITTSTSIHQLMEPESMGAGMHVGISIFVVLLVILVLALILSKTQSHSPTQNTEASRARWKLGSMQKRIFIRWTKEWLDPFPDQHCGFSQLLQN
ncbi:hepatitis A virus cellular receptor 1 homolog isoform X6 [Chelonia mydas]|uniref:hepatitis A virus cellular receptor 1 homolog isoform X6 n=1 Tax=Chelonia mydas TaxID=8469 RepID=UPI001CA93AEC|nr:hepatitis A virus cellular receptor 1 homolog isoform X6 [Chelonia mydas]